MSRNLATFQRIFEGGKRRRREGETKEGESDFLRLKLFTRRMRNEDEDRTSRYYIVLHYDV